MAETLSKAERTRQYIIERTAPVFNEKGYAGTSMQDLTDATGLTKGSIYGNFENKDEVALAVFDYNFGRVTDYLRERISLHDSAIDRLLVYPHVYKDFLKIPFLKAGCPLLNTSTEADDTHPALRERASKALAFWRGTLENQVKRGIERGEIRKGTSPAEVAVILMCLLEGAVMQAKVHGRPTELRIAMKYLENFILSLRP
ncbi:MAG: TetR/AcrR family transcriptional regulator [Bacteroidetes bacterium]|nr:TetR/AcrR family transcriptional regulator [Bacteroidota bacterium]MBS1685655.1 TetR/AcrR family transcriptional regulator [Bacteroidota bacterium]